jgi:hypothetical protein
VHFQEADADDWAVGGELRSATHGKPNHFIVDVIVLQGLGGARCSPSRPPHAPLQ